jgi:hypothetical protein
MTGVEEDRKVHEAFCACAKSPPNMSSFTLLCVAFCFAEEHNVYVETVLRLG